MLSSIKNVDNRENIETSNVSNMEYKLPKINKWKGKRPRSQIHTNTFIKFLKTISLGVIYYDNANGENLNHYSKKDYEHANGDWDETTGICNKSGAQKMDLLLRDDFDVDKMIKEALKRPIRIWSDEIETEFKRVENGFDNDTKLILTALRIMIG
eukprot:528945_1